VNPAAVECRGRGMTLKELVDHCRKLVLDQHQALRTAIANLHNEFDVDIETVERHVYSAHSRLAVHGAVPGALPLLAERSARRELSAQADLRQSSVLAGWDPEQPPVLPAELRGTFVAHSVPDPGDVPGS
jgi:hypothetical protein